MSDSVNELFKKYRETRDVATRNLIAEKYLYIAEILAKRFSHRGVAYEDLLQEASMYLLEAIESFDEARGLQFSTYATPTVTGKLKNYFRDHARLLKVPRRLSELNLEIRRFSEDYLSKNGTTPSVREIAAAIACDEEEVVKALEIGGTVSIDAQVGDDENGRTIGELLPADERGFEIFELKEQLASAMSDFSALEKDLIRCRFVDELSQTDTAERLNVSQMTVSRMERKLLSKLRERLS
ncbi:MAG: sigma-70 family RNA polymerase sigma factor [Clostridia bacterium]|nr:sigma-70 family RNA polymerase sigma factor [Clostridia bacterium]